MSSEVVRSQTLGAQSSLICWRAIRCHHLQSRRGKLSGVSFISCCFSRPTLTFPIFLNFTVFRMIRHHHQVLLLLVEHRASMKSFQALRSPAIPLTSFHVFLVPLISSSVVLRPVLLGLPLRLCPWGFQSNAVFSIAPISLRNVCPVSHDCPFAISGSHTSTAPLKASALPFPFLWLTYNILTIEAADFSE